MLASLRQNSMASSLIEAYQVIAIVLSWLAHSSHLCVGGQQVRRQEGRRGDGRRVELSEESDTIARQKLHQLSASLPPQSHAHLRLRVPTCTMLWPWPRLDDISGTGSTPLIICSSRGSRSAVTREGCEDGDTLTTLSRLGSSVSLNAWAPYLDAHLPAVLAQTTSVP